MTYPPHNNPPTPPPGYPQQPPYPGQQTPPPGFAPPQTPPPGFAAPQTPPPGFAQQPYPGQYPGQPQYPGQAQYPGQQPYPGQPGYPQYPGQPGGQPTSAGTAPIAGLLALVVGVCFGGTVVNFLVDGGLEYLSDVPAGLLFLEIGRLAVAVLGVIGGIMLFTRSRAGVALSIIAAVVALVSVVLEPVALGADFSLFGKYLEAVFGFSSAYSAFLAIGIIASALTILFAALPSTTRAMRQKAPTYGPGY
ncbi:hypothetical protein V5P93_000840 [Actinokineospora auranticolor]|uniref:Uncharacterized protein n=1 Tax=Actinokineospora auranticolor TaxID=155976 RepID=A0A2S6GYH6_9PSEU|nr:hypothetical protein [Actinokineospora auranticolor]PPK70283.1 hypothetical protein CLV40_102194 [Actinokineospora auranticolor]